AVPVAAPGAGPRGRCPERPAAAGAGGGGVPVSVLAHAGSHLRRKVLSGSGPTRFAAGTCRDLRPRGVGRVAVLRVGHHERVREVRVRTVDHRHVVVVDRGRRVAPDTPVAPTPEGADATW